MTDPGNFQPGGVQDSSWWSVLVRGCLLLADGEACHVVGNDTTGRKVSGAFEQGSQVSEAADKG